MDRMVLAPRSFESNPRLTAVWVEDEDIERARLPNTSHLIQIWHLDLGAVGTFRDVHYWK